MLVEEVLELEIDEEVLTRCRLGESSVLHLEVTVKGLIETLILRQ